MGTSISKMKETRELLDKAVAVALRAGGEIMRVYESGDFKTTYKDEGSPLTLADEAANAVIVEGLASIAPDVPILSEESEDVSFDVRSRWDRFWLVDPLDGTKEFIKKNGEFTVNIALIDEGAPVMGVVYAPAKSVNYYAASGLGAFKAGGGKTARIKAADYRPGPLRIVASRSHRTPEIDRFLENIKGAECVSVGSSLKFCIVAEGMAHLYPRFGPTMEWDTAAAQCVVEEAGGAVTDTLGKRLLYNKEDLRNPFFIVTGSPPFPWREHLGQTS